MTSIAAVPSGIDELTPAWLTDVLHGTVTDVRPERIAQDTGFSALLYRLHLTGYGNITTPIIWRDCRGRVFAQCSDHWPACMRGRLSLPMAKCCNLFRWSTIR